MIETQLTLYFSIFLIQWYSLIPGKNLNSNSKVKFSDLEKTRKEVIDPQTASSIQF